MRVYDIGETAFLSARFQDADTEADVDPTAIVFSIKRKYPDGPLTTYTYGVDAAVVKDAVGQYHVDWPVTDKGVYWYSFVGTGNLVAVEESTFTVRTRKVA